MIVRTYGRRTRCVGRSFSDASLLDGDDDLDEPLSLSQEAGSSQQQQDPYGFVAFSSQESSPWSLDSDLFGGDDELPTAPLLLPPPPPLPPLPGNSSNGQHRKPKNPKIKKPELAGPSRVRSPPAPAPTATATLMEAQEFGEMMEHVDEVNFALDGLRTGQPARIRRASLMSLLSICATAQQRRLLRAQGMAKKIIDGVLCLSFDDSPSTVAAAALFYVLASDVQDSHLLDSSSCVRFLLKLLNPPLADTAELKVPTFGCRFLGIRNSGTFSTNKRLDSDSTEIFSKVEEILLSCKEIKPVCGDEATGRPELSSKWIALLTMEKACLSTVSLEDTSGTVRRVGGNFKERLRELGGLDAIFEVAASCHSTMEGWLRDGFPSFWELKDGIELQSAVLLLKCLKIMENATFLSKDNQNHLLEMKTKWNLEGPSLSFVGLVISAIKIISDLSRCQKSPSVTKKKSSCLSDIMTQFCNSSEVQLMESCTDDCNWTSTRDSAGCSVSGRTSNTNISEVHQKRQRLSTSEWEFSKIGQKMTVASGADVCSIKKRADCPVSVSCNGRFNGPKGEVSENADGSGINGSRTNPIRSSNGWVCINLSSSKIKSTGVRNDKISLNDNDLKMDSTSGSIDQFSVNAIGSKLNSVSLRKRPHSFEESSNEVRMVLHDPFAFDEDELEPSKWETLAKKKETSQIHQSTFKNRKMQDRCELLLSSNPETTNEDDQHSCENSRPSVVEEDSNLLEDCLLTSVKVLMNLTNDSPVGCQQIAACGGLDTMASLIISHFPSFDSYTSMHDQLENNILVLKQNNDSGHLNDTHLSDYEIDFLVAILGLLVNLVEKDSRNRSRLASTSIPVAQSVKSEDKENHRDVIPLLCSIFLANRGTGEAAGEGTVLGCDEDAALLQGEREAEMMIIEAYAALLLAFLSTESKTSREAIAGCLPDNNLEILVPVLERFVAFHLSLNMISPETHSAVSEVIESCKAR